MKTNVYPWPLINVWSLDLIDANVSPFCKNLIFEYKICYLWDSCKYDEFMKGGGGETVPGILSSHKKHTKKQLQASVLGT